LAKDLRLPTSALDAALLAAVEVHRAKLGRVPRLAAADAAFYSAKQEAAAKAMGVKCVRIPNRSTKSLGRKREQKKRWFRDGQTWRAGCEGRISWSNGATGSTAAATRASSA
jgi:IS5 family transposase